jgi:hypothetical protein
VGAALFRADRHDEDNNRFTKFFERAKKFELRQDFMTLIYFGFPLSVDIPTSAPFCFICHQGLVQKAQ